MTYEEYMARRQYLSYEEFKREIQNRLAGSGRHHQIGSGRNDEAIAKLANKYPRHNARLAKERLEPPLDGSLILNIAPSTISDKRH